eukprot:GSMAST32.ASY1.ANO1.568.1 assembled CDS
MSWNASLKQPMTVTYLLQHLRNNIAVIALLLFVDHIIVKPFVKRHVKKSRDQSNGRWFFVHAFANLLVCLTAMSSMSSILNDPVNALSGSVNSDRSMFGNGCILHVYLKENYYILSMHCFGLNSADYFHHFLFIPTLGLPGQIFHFGALGNWQAFFISGLPGGLDYFLLGLVKCELFGRRQEKRWSANLNTWCIAPGIIVAASFMYIGVKNGLYLGYVPFWAVALQIGLPQFNALYYGKQSVANYAVNFTLDILKEDVHFYHDFFFFFF